MTRFNTLRERNRMMGNEQERGWIAAPEDIMTVRSSEGFEEFQARDDDEPA